MQMNLHEQRRQEKIFPTKMDLSRAPVNLVGGVVVHPRPHADLRSRHFIFEFHTHLRGNFKSTAVFFCARQQHNGKKFSNSIQLSRVHSMASECL